MNKLITAILFLTFLSEKVFAQNYTYICNSYESIFRKITTNQIKSYTSKFKLEFDNNTELTGCVVKATGTIHSLGEDKITGKIFGGSYHICPDAIKNSNANKKASNNKGWCMLTDADGADGTYLELYKPGVICTYGAAWDGGDITDPSYMPSDRLEIKVRCAPES